MSELNVESAVDESVDGESAATASAVADPPAIADAVGPVRPGVAVDDSGAVARTAPVDSPPPAPRPAEPADDPRAELLRLAAALVHTRDRRLQVEYLRLRRACLR